MPHPQPAWPAWSALFHAYGPALDTPGRLEALRSVDDDERRAAFDHLDSAILHQGTVWPATPRAVAELVAGLAATPEAYPDRGLLLSWLGRVMTEVGVIDLGAEPVVDPTPEQWATLEGLDDDGFAESFEDPEQANAFMVWSVAATRRLAPEVVALARGLIDSDDEAVRTGAADALAAAAPTAPGPGVLETWSRTRAQRSG